MAHVVSDFIKETISTTGTGTTVALSGAVDDCRTFASVMADGDTCDYYIQDQGVGREAGIATYVAASDELTLDVRASTNSNNRISLSGSAKIGIGMPAIFGESISDGDIFRKDDPDSVAWSKTGAFTVETSQELLINVAGRIHIIAAATSITMPGSPSVGTDYVIWVHPDGTLEATSSYDTPPVANARRVGGFHYAPGGNATAQSGGDTTPSINEYSFWDLKWRPACPDPRGMTLVAGKFWADIYHLGVDHHVNGSSAYNVTIADNSNPPKLPDAFGGDGTSVYSNANWWNLTEVLASHGKRPPDYQEFAALAYGTTEASADGTDPVSTILRAAYTSKWGVILATGNMWVWGADFGRTGEALSWAANTQGRGSTYGVSNVARFGGYWNDGSDAGSRCSNWSYPPSTSNDTIGARGVCDHLNLG